MTIRSRLFSIFFPLFALILLVLTSFFYLHYKSTTFKSLKPPLKKLVNQYLSGNKLSLQLSYLPVLQITSYEANGKEKIIYKAADTDYLEVSYDPQMLYLQQSELSSLQEIEENLTSTLSYYEPLSSGGYIEITMLATTLRDSLRHFLFISLLIFVFAICLFALFFAYFERIYAKPIQALNFAGLNIVTHKMTDLPRSNIKEIQDVTNLMKTLGATINEQTERLKESSFIHKKQTIETEMISYLIDQLFTKPIEDFDDTNCQLSQVELETEHPWGSMVTMNKAASTIDMQWSEAQDKGIKPLIEQLHGQVGSSLHLTLKHADKSVHFIAKRFPEPQVFSVKNQTLQLLKDKEIIKTGDILLLCNSAMEQFIGKENMNKLAQKIIAPFYQEGLKAVTQLLSKELYIKEQKSILHNDARMILIQIS